MGVRGRNSAAVRRPRRSASPPDRRMTMTSRTPSSLFAKLKSIVSSCPARAKRSMTRPCATRFVTRLTVACRAPSWAGSGHFGTIQRMLTSPCDERRRLVRHPTLARQLFRHPAWPFASRVGSMRWFPAQSPRPIPGWSIPHRSLGQRAVRNSTRGHRPPQTHIGDGSYRRRQANRTSLAE